MAVPAPRAPTGQPVTKPWIYLIVGPDGTLDSTRIGDSWDAQASARGRAEKIGGLMAMLPAMYDFRTVDE